MDACNLAFNSHLITLGVCMSWAMSNGAPPSNANIGMDKEKAQNMVDTLCTPACVTGITNLRRDVTAACSPDKESYKNAVMIYETQQGSCIKDGSEWCQVKMVTLTGNGKGEVTDWKAFCGPCLEKQAKVFTDPTVSISKLPVNSSSNETLSDAYKNYIAKCASMGYTDLKGFTSNITNIPTVNAGNDTNNNNSNVNASSDVSTTDKKSSSQKALDFSTVSVFAFLMVLIAQVAC